EDRDYMYRTYASDPEARINLGIRRRLAPLLGNHRRKMELMNGLLLALPGTPVIYYGDELGMGDNIYLGDRDGVRTPMQWSSDRNAGFSRANPQRLYLPVIIDPEYHYETVNVEAQQANPHSLLWWMKRIIALRKRHKAFGRGSIEFLYPENARILAFIREYEDEHILVVANLSRFVQAVELDLTRFRGATPIEMFGRTHLPPVGEAPYFLTLGPHAFYWFILQARTDSIMAEPNAAGRTIPTLTTSGSWTTVFRGRAVSNLTALLPEYLRGRRWFGGKARTIQTVHVVDAVPIGGRAGREPKAFLALLSVEYREGEPETYMLPLGLARGERSEALMQEAPQAIVARIESRTDGGTGILFDASLDEEFGETLLSAIARGRSFEGTGKLTASPTPALRRIRSRADGPLCPTVLRAEQSNTSIVYGDKLILKLFRRPERGINPDLELGRFITERTKMRHVPQVAGYIEYRAGRSEPMTLAILQAYVPNEGDAWRYTIDELDRYFERVLALGTLPDERLLPRQPMALLAASPTPSAAEDAIGAYLESARLLGQRTAELHLALASSPEDKNLAPEPFTPFYQRSLFQSMRNLTAQMLSLLRRSIDRLPEAAREEGLRIAELEPVIIERFQRINQSRLNITRIRCHGDYHLGQVLYTGNDFVIIDFEGEPARPLSERRLKRSPLRDVAGMLRSFHYAAYTALLEADGAVRDEDRPMLESWARVWHTWVSATFLRAYLETAAGASFLPADSGDLVTLLDAFIMEKAVYELGYELNNRPEWVRLPLQGILQLLEEGSS
ncbi:MAG TPA: putative maltokinase, partial [Dehalococcoidia bacterium]|nr:putative maltokinase [Dehalococcoidia bacterium]